MSLPVQTARTNTMLTEIIAGTDELPRGVVNIVTGGFATGDALVRSPDVPVISFTGSTRTGRAISATAAQHLKRVGLELGGGRCARPSCRARSCASGGAPARPRQNPAATPAPDLRNRDFTATAPNRLWVADATRIVRAGRVLAGCGARCVLQPDRRVAVLGPLRHRPRPRRAGVRGLVPRHPRRRDRSPFRPRLANYTSLRFGQRLDDHGILASMGSVGDSYDNALMENFLSTLKTELVYRTSWRTREEAENALFASFDGWYSTERIQARLGWLSPDQYEVARHARQAVLDDQPATPADGADPAPAR